MTSTTRLQHRDGLHMTNVDDELVVLSPTGNRYFGLDEVGRAVWEHFATPATVDEVTAALLTEFDVDAERCRADVVAFTDRLLADGLLVAVA